MAPWRIELFGGLICRRGDVVIDRFRTRKAASLLALLALHPDRSFPREELIDLFWPEMDSEAARTNLRQALSCLRRTLECDCQPVLIADNSTVRLIPGSVVTDVAEFAIAKSYYDRALAKFTSLNDDRGRAVTLLCNQFVSTAGGVSHSLAQQSASQSLGLFKKLQNPWGISMALHSMGVLEENVAKAKELIQQSAAAYPEANGISEKECEEQAIVATQNGDLAKARASLIREMQIARDRNNRMGVAYALEMFVPRCPVGSIQAARVFGATEALNNQLGIINGPE